jgi:sorting nexin-25
MKGHQIPVYTIIVHRQPDTDEESESPSQDDLQISSMIAGSSGWVVTRKLTEFEAMHWRLKQCGLLKQDLPKPSQGLFGSKDRAFLEKSRQLLEGYLQTLLRDEKLCSNEELYHFLIPSPERLRQGSLKPVPQKKFFSTEVLKSVPFLGDFIESLIASAEEADEDEDLEGSRDRRDSIAEPLYGLIREVFELKGVFKWLRRQLMVFVQITFGRTINKHIRETVKWLTCDGMIVYYVHTFRDSWWPNGKLAPSRPVRSDEEKAATKDAAKEKLLKNIPAVLQSFVGQKNSRRGVLKLFESLQDAKANKHIFYVLFELLLYNLIPEVKSEVRRYQSMQPNQQTPLEEEPEIRNETTTVN